MATSPANLDGAVEILSPSQRRQFEAAVADPMFWPWLVVHATGIAGKVPDGHPWQAWLLRVKAIADDLPELLRTPVEVEP